MFRTIRLNFIRSRSFAMIRRTTEQFFAFCAVLGTFPCVLSGKAWKSIKWYPLWSLTISAISFLRLLVLWAWHGDVRQSIASLASFSAEPVLRIIHLCIIISQRQKMCNLMNVLSRRVFATYDMPSLTFTTTKCWCLLALLGFAIQVVFCSTLPWLYLVEGCLSTIGTAVLFSGAHQFSWLIRLTTSKLNALNDDLNEKRVLSYGDAKLLTMNYAKTVELVELVSNTYGPMLLVIITTCFINYTTSTSYLLAYFPAVPPINIFIGGIWTCAYYALMVWDLVSSAEAVTIQDEKFNKLLVERVMKYNTELLPPNPYIDMHFASWKPITITACGCFNVNYKLGCSMIAACVSYLVVLAQVYGNQILFKPGAMPSHFSSTKLQE